MVCSGLFLEYGAAVAASDGDFAFAPGHPQGLGAGGAFKIDMVFVPGLVALALEPVDHRTEHLQEGIVLCPAATVIAAHDAEDHRRGQQQRDPTQHSGGNLVAHKGLRQPKQKENHQQKEIQLIGAIAAVHQPLNKIADHKKYPIHSVFYMMYLNTEMILRQ